MAEEKIISIKVITEAQTNEIAALQKRLVEMTKARNDLNKKIREGLPLTKAEQQELGRLQPELVATRNKLRDLEREVVKNNDALKKNSGFVAGVKRGMQQAMTSAAAFAAGFVAIGAAVIRAFNTVKDFEQGLAELGSITGLQGQELDNLGKKAIDLSKKFGTSAKDILKGFQLVGSASPQLLENADALAYVTEQAEILSKAGGLTLPEAAEALTKSMNQFGASAEEAAAYTDILATSQQKGTATIQQLSESMKNVGSVAKASGLSFEATNAALQGLAKGGLTGAEAGTQLRGVLLRLAKTGREELNPATQDLGSILNTLSTEITDVNKASALFGAENAAAALTLINQRDAVISLNGALNEQGNALAQANNNTNTIGGSIDKLLVAWDNLILGIENGTNFIGVAFKGIVDFATYLLTNISKLFDSSYSGIDRLKIAYNLFIDAVFSGVKLVNTALDALGLGVNLDFIESLKFEVKEVKKEVDLTTEALTDNTTAIQENIEADKKATKTKEDLNKQLKEQAEAQEYLNSLLNEYKNFSKDFEVEFFKVDKEKEAADELNALADELFEEQLKREEKEAERQDAKIEKEIEDQETKNETIRKNNEQNLALTLQAAETATQALSALSTLRANKEIADIERKRKAGTISETEYLKSLNTIKEKDFKNQKRYNIALATINAAQAAIRAFSDYEYPYSLIIAALAAASAGIQIGTIKAQEYEPIEYADGGLLQGNSHANGGIPISVNGQSGYEAEGGEAIINKKSTKMFRPLLSAINEAGGGVSFAGGNNIKRFAVGGLTPNVSNNNVNLQDLISSVNNRIDNIKVINVATETTSTATRVTNIQNNASFN